MDPSVLHEAVDLSQFSAAECSRIWEVLQRDFQVRYEETRNINRIQSRVAQANEKINLLGEIDKFNDKYCIVCFDSFIFIINPSYVCYMCQCNVCKKCSRVISKVDGRLCQLCNEEHYLVARQCSWFYEKKRRTFVVGDHPTALTKDRLEASANTSEKDSNSKRGSLVPNGAAISPNVGRDENEEVLKRITGMQIMRFQQKMNTVATEVRSFLRKDVSYEIPEAGVDRHYDMKIKSFNDEVINILRNFSQTLYIAIEGYHSRTGKPLRNVHQEVLFILQDEVENLVGYRVDVRQDDEVASMVSDDEITSSLYGPGNIQEKLSHILMEKWIADHQSYLDDQKVTASDLYTHNALEDFMNKKAHDSMDYRRLSLDDEWQQPDEDFIQSKRNKGVFCGAPTGLNEVDPDMLSLQDSRQLEGSCGGSSSGTGNWLLKGKPNVTGNYGESMHHFDDTPSPRIGRKNALELSDELSESEESSEVDEEENSFLSEVENENERKKSTASIDFDDVYNQNLTIYSDTTPEKTRDEGGVKSEDSGVHVNGNVASPVTRVESIGSEGSGRARKVSLGFLRMDWSFSERSDPCFISKTTEVSCKVAECASISVEVDGTMPIDVYWYRASSDDLVQLEENDRIEFVSANDHPGKHTLHVWHIEEGDEGEYLAVAVNEQGSNKQGFKISVLPNDQSLKEPEFQRPLSSDEVRKGETGRLRCKVAGYPHPRVFFMRDGKHISNTDRFQLMRIGERAYTLSIHDVQPEDKGVYTCTATNAAGSCQSEATLDVISSPSNPAPRFDGEMLVDTSPAVNVRSQVQKLGKDELSGSTLFVDKVEPLTKPSAGDIKVKNLPNIQVSNAHPRRRDLLDLNKPRGNSRLGREVKEDITPVRAASVERSPLSAKIRMADNSPKKEFDEPLESEHEDEHEKIFNGLLLDLSEDEKRIDCGLKPVNDRYRRDFVIKQDPASSDEPKSSLLRPVTSTAKRIELKLRKPSEPESPNPVDPSPKEPLPTEDTEDAIDFTTEKQQCCAVEPKTKDVEESNELTTANLQCKERLSPENHVISFDANSPDSAFDASSEEEEQLSIAQRKDIGWNPWVEGSSYSARNTAIPKRKEMDWNPKSPTQKEGTGDRIELEEDVNSLKNRFERGISNPHQPNPYASFRTRKFPSVAAIKDQFSTTPPPRGSYVKRLPDLQEELSIPKRSSASSLPVKRSNTLPPRSSVQPTASSSRIPKPQPPDSSTTSDSCKDKLVVPEFFHVKLKPTGRQIDN